MKKAIIVSASYVLPYIAFAQASFAGLTTLAQSFRTFLGVIFPIVFAIAMIYFFWGVANKMTFNYSICWRSKISS
jgi:hypothetical protein